MAHPLTSAFTIIFLTAQTAVQVGTSVPSSSSSPSASQSTPKSATLDNPNYFEGDLDIPQEMIDAYYEQPKTLHVSFKYSLTALYIRP